MKQSKSDDQRERDLGYDAAASQEADLLCVGTNLAQGGDLGCAVRERNVEGATAANPESSWRIRA